MALQLQDLRDALERRKKDISDVDLSTFVEWCNFIGDFVYDHINGVDPERYVDTTNTYTVSADPQTNALPIDFDDIAMWDQGFFEIDSNGKDTDRRLVRTGPGDTRPGYYISGDNVIFTGINSGQQYRLRYTPQRTIYTGLTDYFTLDATQTGATFLPDSKLRYAVAALDTLYTIWDEQPGDEATADQRFVRQLDQLLSHIKKEPAAYGMFDYSQNF